MDIEVKCNHCNNFYDVDETHTGQEIECPDCGKKFIISPNKTTQPADVEEPANDLEISEGHKLFDLYEVKRITQDQLYVEGGFGRVYRVHHPQWKIDLVMKMPLIEKHGKEDSFEQVSSEFENWIELGMHPNIVSCHYVRSLDGNPCIFAEFIDGGTLDQWISSGRLYEGNDDEVLERILDIAIQAARGLNHAHTHGKGMIHQDMKPENVMMTETGEAKITDFGISGARQKVSMTLPSSQSTDFNGTIVADGVAYTPKYCAPEQAERKTLTRRVDIWSWAITVLEMFTGAAHWQFGSIVGECLDEYLTPDMLRIVVPEQIQELLRHCFKREESERPHDFAIILEKLKSIYQKIIGESYSRPNVKGTGLQAAGLNNRALSMLDMGNEEQAERFWKQALELERTNLEAVYNYNLWQWRNAKIDDSVAVQEMKNLKSLQAKNRHYHFLLGQLHLERRDAPNSLMSFDTALSLDSDNKPIRELRALAESLKGWMELKQIFKGHSNGVNSVCFSPDKKYALSGSDDKSLKLWDINTGQCQKTFEGHTDDVWSVSFSPDGRYVLSGSWDKTMKLWDINTGQCQKTFEGHTDSINSVAINPDGKRALSGSWDKTMKLWQIGTGECLRTFVGHTNRIYSVCFSPDGKYMLSGSWDRTLKLWDIDTGECLKTFEGHTGWIHSLCFSPDGKYAISGSKDTTMKLWDIDTGKCFRTFEGHTADVNSVCFSPDGKYAISGSEDKTLKLWNIDTCRCLRTFEGHTGWIHSVCFSLDGKYAISGSTDKTLKLWDIQIKFDDSMFYKKYVYSRSIDSRESVKMEKLLSLAEALITNHKYDDAHSLLERLAKMPGQLQRQQFLRLKDKISAANRRTNLVAGWKKGTFKGHKDYVTSVCFSPNGKHILSGSKDKTMKLWNITTGKCLRTFEGHRFGVNSVCFSPNGKYALSGSSDNTLRLWDIVTGECVRTFEGHRDNVSSVCFSPDGKHTLSGSKDHMLRLWDVATGECVRTYEGHTGEVNSVGFSPNGKHALSGSGYKDQTMRLWDISTGKCLRIFEESFYTSISFSPDGKYALSGSYDNTMRLWDINTGKFLRTFRHTSFVLSVSFSPDGKHVLSGSANDDKLKLWDVATGQCLKSFEGDTQLVYSVCFSQDGNYALSGSGDNTLKLWYLNWDYEIMESADWDKGAEPYLQNFLTLRNNQWNDDDFNSLINDLQNRGYGWLRPEGVRKKLEEMTIDIDNTNAAITLPESESLNKTVDEAEKNIDIKYLTENLNQVIDKIDQHQTVFFISLNVDDSKSKAKNKFVLCPESIGGKVFGLNNDSEYGWPVKINLEKMEYILELAPGIKRHPIIFQKDKCVAVSIQMNEYQIIKNGSK